jgi:hypothetical protein
MNYNDRSPYPAYLIIICDMETNAILDCVIWSSPEWEQSRRLGQPTYIAYECSSYESFSKSKQLLLKRIEKNERYSRLLKFSRNIKDLYNP